MKYLISIIFISATISCHNNKIKHHQNNSENRIIEESENDMIFEIKPSVLSEHINSNYYMLPGDKFIYCDYYMNNKCYNILSDSVSFGFNDGMMEQQNILIKLEEKEAKEISIKPGWYYCNYIRLDMRIQLPQGFYPIPIESINCGLMPFREGKRGYIASMHESKFCMFTYVYAINREKETGIAIDKFYPKIGVNSNDISQIEWRFALTKNPKAIKEFKPITISCN
jgi:hypothetical protein